MNFLHTLAEFARDLRAQKLRTFLTIFGITWGTVAVIVLLAFGKRKKAIVRRAIEGPITTRIPGSLLQLHPNTIVVLDREAAG